MRDYGNSDGHSNSDSWGDLAAVDAPTSYTIAFFVKVNTNPGSTYRSAFAKVDSAYNNGWACFSTSAAVRRFYMNHRSGGGGAGSGLNNTAFTLGVTGGLLAVWNGTNLYFYKDGAADGSVAYSQAIANTAGNLKVGAGDSLGGLACAVGQAAFWKNYQLSAGEIAQYFAGVDMPAVGNLSFWSRLIAEPPKDEVGGTNATEGGTVTLLSDPVDNYFYGSGGAFAYLVAQWLPPLLAVASHCLSRREISAILRGSPSPPVFPEEFARLLEAFRVRPRFCFQGGTR